MAKFLKAKLSYTPTHCSVCGVKNVDYTFYKNGTKTSNMKLPTLGVYPTYLQLKKQHFFNKEYKRTFIAQTDITKDSAVTPTTVQRVITKEAKKYKPHYRYLPAHLSFDEFKYAKGQRAFEYVDAETGDIIDI